MICMTMTHGIVVYFDLNLELICIDKIYTDCDDIKICVRDTICLYSSTMD